MAKKKNNNKKKAQPQQFMSPDKYLRERMRSVPIGKCYVTRGYKECGFCNIVVSRVHTGGRISFAAYLVDTFCLGVKECFYMFRVEDYEFEETTIGPLERQLGLEEVTYEEAHNLIYGAVAFAEEAGFAPCKEFALCQYFLQEDTEDIPLIEYEFGKDGKHSLMAKNQLELSTYLPTLQKNLPEGQYDYTVTEEDEDEDWDEGEDWDKDDLYDFDDDYLDLDDLDLDDVYKDDFHDCEEKKEYPDFYDYNAYPYTYRFQNLPSSLNLKHPRILEIMQQKKNWLVIPKKQLDEIMALPHEEVRQDLEQIILYGIHEMVNAKGECDEKAAKSYGFPISHSAMLLGEVGNESSSLSAVLETLRMPHEAIDRIYGDGLNMSVTPTIIKLAPHAINTLLTFLLEEGIVNSFKAEVMVALVNIAHYYPDTHDKVKAAFQTFMEHALHDKQKAQYTDYTLNGMLICSLLDFYEKDLWPQIEQMYKLKLVDNICAGNVNSVKRDLLSTPRSFYPCDIDLEERYRSMFRAFGHNG